MGWAEDLNVTVSGRDRGRPVVFVHGFGCGQQMWRHVAPAFEADQRVVLFDLPGSGGADDAAYDAERYATLEGYRDAVVGLLRELDLRDVVLVGHSVSAMIVVLVQIAAPELVDRLVLVAPSARYLDDVDYHGGFSEGDLEELFDLMERNHLGWQEPLAHTVAAGSAPEVEQELVDSFCRTRPEVAAQFAQVTFRSDNRDDLPRVDVPTLVLQARDDAVAPMSAGEYVHQHIAGSQFVVVETRGHCPHLSAPEATRAAILRFVASGPE